MQAACQRAGWPREMDLKCSLAIACIFAGPLPPGLAPSGEPRNCKPSRRLSRRPSRIHRLSFHGKVLLSSTLGSENQPSTESVNPSDAESERSPFPPFLQWRFHGNALLTSTLGSEHPACRKVETSPRPRRNRPEFPPFPRPMRVHGCQPGCAHPGSGPPGRTN